MPFWLYKTAPDVVEFYGGLLEWYGGSSLKNLGLGEGQEETLFFW